MCSKTLADEHTGTGTRVGDPAEAEAVETAFFTPDHHVSDDEFLYIGSIKTFIGHTEGTAGIAGILRASFALQHSVIPPNLHFKRAYPPVMARGKHLKVPTEPQPWPNLPQHTPRRASANSFGELNPSRTPTASFTKLSRIRRHERPCDPGKLRS